MTSIGDGYASIEGDRSAEGKDIFCRRQSSIEINEWFLFILFHCYLEAESIIKTYSTIYQNILIIHNKY